MLFIPGPLLALLTFPGVIVHEIAHRLFCDLAGIPVFQVSYFRLANPAGYVVHGKPGNLRQAFLIAVGPLIVNSILCSLICLSAAFPLYVLDVRNPDPIFVFQLWLGLSIGMHAFPSKADMNNFINYTEDSSSSGLLMLGARVFGSLISLANVLRIVWFDAIYAVGVAVALPLLITRL